MNHLKGEESSGRPLPRSMHAHNIRPRAAGAWHLRRRIRGGSASSLSARHTSVMARLWATTGDAVARLDDEGDGRRVALFLEGTKAQCLAADPEDRDTVYVGLREAGIRKTTDGGATWQECELPEPGVFSLAVGPVDGAVYAGTEPSRLFRSDDGGETWRELDDPARAAVAADVELSAAALDVARPLDRAEPARRGPAPRRDRARRPHALDRRRRDVARPSARGAARRPLARLAPARCAAARTRRAAAAPRGATTAATRGTRRTTGATATTRGRSPSIPAIPTAGTSPRAPARSRRTAVAIRRRASTVAAAATRGRR